MIRPLALGYLRLHTADSPNVTLALTAKLQAFAEKEHLNLVHADSFDPPVTASHRAGFCALMDGLRRTSAHAVIIPSADHLSRRSGGFYGRRTIIETEGGARLLIIRP